MDQEWKYWTVALAVAERLIAVAASLHAVLTKRETQSVIGWVGLIWLSPLLGSLLYYCLGINRIARKGRRIQQEMHRRFRQEVRRGKFLDEDPRRDLPFEGRLEEVVSRITGKSLLSGNAVTLLEGGECAYPQMLSALDNAQRSVSLCSYIFDNDRAGKEFAQALGRARDRGVEVRVLIDDVGSRYSSPTMVRELRTAGVPVATFLPSRVPWAVSHANLRNHRKLMVVDGAVGFTGGMNIREGCRGDWQTRHAVQDIHFRIEGPVVTHIQETFVTDWAFACGEQLQGETWFSAPQRRGDVYARGIPDGPDSDLDNIRLVILAGLSVAQRRIDVLTPYFLPDDAVISSLNIAAMRGVRVRIAIPEVNNIRMVKWASMDPIWRILERGCRVYETPQPFDHSKVMLVDDCWTLLGSSNWDPRSLRLNFEFNVECYSTRLNQELSALVDAKIARSKRLTMADLKARPLPVRLRDGIARIAIPYL